MREQRVPVPLEKSWVEPQKDTTKTLCIREHGGFQETRITLIRVQRGLHPLRSLQVVGGRCKSRKGGLAPWIIPADNRAEILHTGFTFAAIVECWCVHVCKVRLRSHLSAAECLFSALGPSACHLWRPLLTDDDNVN